jgi:CheY-like chemotaxis protein
LVVFAPSTDVGFEVGAPTVLVVEDEVLVRLATAEALRKAGFVVLEAATADEARIVLMSFPGISAVFSDIQMPGTHDGIELRRFILANYPDVGIVLTSGAVPPPDHTDATFLPKPYDLDHVVVCLGEVLKRTGS